MPCLFAGAPLRLRLFSPRWLFFYRVYATACRRRLTLLIDYATPPAAGFRFAARCLPPTPPSTPPCRRLRRYAAADLPPIFRHAADVIFSCRLRLMPRYFQPHDTLRHLIFDDADISSIATIFR